MRKTYGDAVTLALMRKRQTALLGRNPMTPKRKAQQGKYPILAAYPLTTQLRSERRDRTVVQISHHAAEETVSMVRRKIELDFYCALHIFKFQRSGRTSDRQRPLTANVN
jgi:hypothetical protein